MIFELGELDLLSVVFGRQLWHNIIDHVTVYADEQVVFRLKGGKDIVSRL